MPTSTNITDQPTTHWPDLPISEQATRQNDAVDALVDRLIAELTAGWRDGTCPRAEVFLQRHPELLAHAQGALRLVMAELALRQQQGQTLSRFDLVRRFPHWQTELQALLASGRFEGDERTPLFPEVGETLGSFELVAELGRGAKGIVYLARQKSLADRPVVLKLTAWEGLEHLSLARLQHTNIVPLFDVHEFPTARLRALCMPYLGGLALDQLLRRLVALPLSGRNGKLLIDQLDESQARSSIQVSGKGGARALLTRASYVEAFCWIGACLADALQYAHERGLVHLDIKPGNVLIAADGTPLLLDFHLARAPLQANGPLPAWFGGTPDYMAPEQRAALVAVSRRPPIPVAVDGRADIYALGVLLYEALGGKLARWSADHAPLKTLNPEVSQGLSDIVERCLHLKPEERYPTAAALAEDLRRHLTGQPLRGVANRSWTERWRKWRQRKPQGLSRLAFSLTFALGLAAGIGLVGVLAGERWHDAQAALSEARHEAEAGDHRAAREHAALGQQHLRYLPLQLIPPLATLEADLRQQEQISSRALAADELHAFMEALRAISNLEGLSHEQSQRLAQRCDEVWTNRERFLQRLSADIYREANDPLFQDILDCLLVGNQLRIVQATSNKSEAHRQALARLVESEPLWRASLVLWKHKQRHHEALQETQQATACAARVKILKPVNAWELTQLGQLALEAGDLGGAAQFFQQAVQREPAAFWSHFRLGHVQARAGEQQQAWQEFNVCVALKPDLAECWYNRALAATATRKHREALADYAQTIALRPAFADAWLNRGLMLIELDRAADALTDLDKALELGADPFSAHLGLAVAQGRVGNLEEAQASCKRALIVKPDDPKAKALLQTLNSAVSKRR